MKKILKNVNEIASAMSTIDRFSQTRLINPESVLEHTGFVCFCSLMIGKELEKAGEEINFGTLLIKATLHDIEETITGDIACPTKYWNEDITKQVKAIEAEAAQQVLNKLDPSQQLYMYWLKSKEYKEGFIVAIADKLAIVYKAQQEINDYSNQTLKGHMKGLIPSLRDLKNTCKTRKLIVNKDVVLNILDEAIEICQKLK